MSAHAAASVGAGLGEPPGTPTLLATVGTLAGVTFEEGWWVSPPHGPGSSSSAPRLLWLIL